VARERSARVSKQPEPEKTARVRTQAPGVGSRADPRASTPAEKPKVEPRPKKPRNLRVVEKKAPKAKKSQAALKQRVSSVRASLTAFGERFRNLGKLLLGSVSVVIAIACAVAAGRFVQHHLTTSKAFAIDTVEIRGLGRMSRSELLAAAGIDVGTNVFEKSPEEVRARLLQHPWVASASVQRRLPGRFDIELREREPVALLVVESCPHETQVVSQDPSCDDPSSMYLVSDEATVFKRLEGQDPVDLPVITGVDKQALATDRESEQRVLKEAVALLSDYRSAGLFRKLSIGEIHLENTGGFSLYVGDSLTHVRLGTPPFAQKLRRMKKVFERLEHEHASAEYVYLDNDVRPDRVTVRLR
jgi:cell division protein FtsQ